MVHFIATCPSRLNLVERWFDGIAVKRIRQAIRVDEDSRVKDGTSG